MPTTPIMAPSTPPAMNGVFSPPLTPAQNPDRNSKNIDSSDDDCFPGHLPAESTLLGQTQVEPPFATARLPQPIPTTTRSTYDPRPPTPGDLPHRGSHPIKNIGPHEQSGGVPRQRSAAHIRSYTDEDGPDAHTFPRISKPVELIRSSYDCVVIGSGYGGSIAASRMARAGKSVCLLERGREKWPGEYPTSTIAALKEVHYSGKFAPYFLEGKLVDGGDPSGMFHLMFGRGQNAIVGNGLGGTSLINANVFMEADRETLAMKVWPPEIRNNVDEMETYYKKVEAVLEPTEYPDEWPELPKLNMLKKQAEKIGQGHNFKKVKQTTRFHNGPNSCGVEMSPSALTGQDATGVNDGSKTTTLVTYLADAWNWGAEMFCECEVRHIEKAKGREGYLIFFAWHGRNRGAFKANLHGDLMWVHAKDVVFLGAGAIGTTEILLRSKALGLSMSDQVGQNMSGNGDILAFGYNLDEQVHAIGKEYPSPYHPVGPTINGFIDCRTNTANPLDGFVIEEGTVPQALAYFLQTILDLTPGTKPNENETLAEKTQAAFARYGSRFLGPYYKNGAIERTQVYLIMSHDSNQAVLTLENDIPVLEFLGVGRSDHVKKLHKLLAKATEAMGGTFVNNPFFGLLGDQEVTVHPIGGAHMARDNTGATGVVNHAGQVFTGCGSETYEGLIVTDGAVIPAALGANPFATIAALAERSVEKYAHARDLSINTEKNGILDLFGEPKHVPCFFNGSCGGSLLTKEEEQAKAAKKLAIVAAKVVAFEAEFSTLEDEVASISDASEVMSHARKLRAPGFGFTEVMSGFIHHDEHMVEDRRATYELAYRTAKSRCESARFFLSVQAFDTETLVKESHHRALLTGTFVCPTIPGSPFMVHRGEFNLFIMDHKAPGTKNLVYDFDMTGVDGHRLHFHGYKVVDSSVALAPAALWRSTTTLYVTISEHEPGMCRDLDDDDAWRRAKVLAKGMMHIHPGDFLSEVMTMSPTGSGLLQRVGSAVNFLTYFTRKSLSLFLAPFTPLQYPKQTYKGYVNETSPDETIAIVARDGVTTRMLVWEPTSWPGQSSGATKDEAVKDLFMVPGAAVDHQIFALPTIPFHAVNYFCRAGYRVHVAVHRIGMVAAAAHDFTTYEARLDLRACLEYIRAQRGEKPVYTIAHCMGSVALSCGMLDGTIPANWILGLTCSQVFMNPIWQPLNMIKAAAGPIPLDKLYGAICGDWFSCSSSPDDSIPQRLINQILRFYPDYRKELCNSATCHRTSLVFGRCWNHTNLNEATHRQLHRFMGGVNMTLLALLMRMGTQGFVTTSADQGHENLVTDENVARLKDLPFLLFVGRDNAVLSAESTERTYEILCDKFAGPDGPTDKYKRRIVPGYGHLDCWMGRNAWKDIYPFVREEVDRVTRGEHYRFEEPDDKFKHMVDSGQLLY